MNVNQNVVVLQNDTEPTSVLGIQADVLELIAQRAPLQKSLSLLCARAEQLVGDCLSSVMVLEGSGDSLCVLAAPSFPVEAIADFNGLKPGPNAGSCGTTVYSGEATVVTDVLSDERWCDIIDLAVKYKLGACWSFPIFVNGELIGSFAITSFTKRTPTALDEKLLSTAASLAGFAIERARADETLRHTEIAFENTSEGIVIADKDGVISRSNSAFHRICGYSKNEISGQQFLDVLIAHSTHRMKIDKKLAVEKRWRGESELPTNGNGSIASLTNITVALDESGEISQYICVVSDISTIKESEGKLHRLAHHDPLTGLLNRYAFETRLKNYLRQHCSDEKPIALMFIDLDNFKTINDAQGHATGDELLKLVGKRVRECMRDEDVIARFGGDEFTLMMPYKNINTVEQLARRLTKELGKPYRIQSREYFSSASIGIALAPRDGQSMDELIQNADAAMYKAKSIGRNCHTYYSAELTTTIKRKLLLESSLRRALDQDELFLEYQPQFDADGDITTVEALLRWHSKEHGIVAPGEFIPVAEGAGLIQRMGNWVLRKACHQAKHWIEQELPLLHISVNVSANQLDKSFCENLENILNDAGLDPSHLELEITESTIMDQVANGVEILEKLRNIGVILAIDDFGTGYSSLSHLKRFPVQSLKIDRSLVMDLPDDQTEMAIINAVVAMGHALDLSVIAEGVETQGQFNALKTLGCDKFQGFLLGKPQAAHDIDKLLLQFRNRQLQTVNSQSLDQQH